MALASCSSRAQLGFGAHLEKGDKDERGGSLTRLLLAMLPSDFQTVQCVLAAGCSHLALDQATEELNRKLLRKWLQTRAHAPGLRCSGERQKPGDMGPGT